jgi:hypothetical protein
LVEVLSVIIAERQMRAVSVRSALATYAPDMTEEPHNVTHRAPHQAGPSEGTMSNAAAASKNPADNPFAEFLRPSGTRPAAPPVRGAAPGPFAAKLTAGLIILVVGAVITYIDLSRTTVSTFETIQLSGWVVLGGLVGVVGLALTSSGFYALLRNLEVHFEQTRRRA